MRAAKKSKTKKTSSASKSRKAFKITSAGFAAVVAAAIFIVPTSTLAPGVEAFSDSRNASYSVGDVDKFSAAIADNRTEVTTAPAAQTVKTNKTVSATAPAATVPSTTAPAAKTSTAKTSTSKTGSSASSATQNKTAAASSVIKAPQTARAATTTVSDIEESSYSYNDYSGSTGSKSSSSAESSYSYSGGSSYYDDDDYDYDYGYYDDDDDDDSYDYSSSQSGSSYSYGGNALIDISNPDYSYSATHISLSSYDRAKLERLVMGEAGTMGFTGCAVVAQAIRDSMVRSNTNSIDQIISEYQYFGSTSIQPNSDVLAAVSYIFDQDGIAVQHRVMCFYIGYSAWHETQTYLCTIEGVRFFDLNVA